LTQLSVKNHVTCPCKSTPKTPDGFISGTHSKTLGQFLGKRRLENDLFAKELASLIGVTEDTVLNWEKSRTYPSQNKIILLKERLDIDPFDLIKFDGAISDRQKSIIDLITERGSITRKCQDLLGLRQQYAQNELYFLYRLGVLRRAIGQRRKATYFLAEDIED
jgi:transcriptional regulator with XRE-family HTH domain